MKVLIAYASETGTTAECARRLAAKIDGAVALDLRRERVDIATYDAVIVGGSIRMGQLHTAAVDFIAKNKAAIVAKPYGLFICCGFINQADEFIEKNFSEDLRRGAVAVDAFGGELDISKLKGVAKLVAKAAIKTFNSGDPMPSIRDDRIDTFAKKFV